MIASYYRPNFHPNDLPSVHNYSTWLSAFNSNQNAIAAAEEKLNDWKVGRDNTNIAALSSQYNAANQDLNKGLWGMASGLMTYATAQEDSEDGDGGGDKKTKKDKKTRKKELADKKKNR